ncbi:transmembrane protein 186 [Hylaeus anthracinus]|uniref:transmembrane protein 186 n=1 Tax=Hylaeus anthracinus TaxID=313031 RepID=UPI0023B91E70|nr:transmembrane protein 186 [Hylaeus anthracinus]
MIQSSAFLRSACVYGRLMQRVSVKVDTTIRHCSKITYKREKNHLQVNKSVKYPDYKIIYSFPYVRYTSFLNVLKRNQTIVTGALIPIFAGLQLLNIVSMDDNLSVIVTSCSITLALHIPALLCNNLVGVIYFKEDDQTVILSYLNYWGTRVDLKTDVANITPLSETPLNINHRFYRILNIKSQKEKLKLYILHGDIHERVDFETAFGISRDDLY